MRDPSPPSNNCALYSHPAYVSTSHFTTRATTDTPAFRRTLEKRATEFQERELELDQGQIAQDKVMKVSKTRMFDPRTDAGCVTRASSKVTRSALPPHRPPLSPLAYLLLDCTRISTRS